MCHLNKNDKNIYLFGEVHMKNDMIACGDEETPIMIDWLRNDIIPKFVDNSILDIFIEKPYSYKQRYIDSPDEKKEKRISELLESNQTYHQMETLIVKPPKNTRIHTIDIRNELSSIIGRLGYLDFMIREYVLYPNCCEYICKNHYILIKCMDILIDWFNIMFFKEENKIIEKNKLIKLINNELIVYINGLEKLIKASELYKLHLEGIDKSIKLMKSHINEILLNIDFIPITNFNSESEEGLLINQLFNKIYKKMDEKYKPKFIELNGGLFSLRDIFIKKYRNFKKFYHDKLSNKNISNIDILSQNFDDKKEIPEFNNIHEVSEIFISLLADFMDLYVIGRVLKPYIKSCFVYTGFSHTKNIYNNLMNLGFTIKNETSKISDITWSDRLDNTKHCINIKNLELHI
jgi:hypothetical protein